MDQPFKVCPHCGQRAVLHMVQCGRCGFLYVPPVQPSPPSTSGRPLSERANAEFRTSPQSRSVSPPAILLSLLFLLIAGGWIASRMSHAKDADLDAFSDFSMHRAGRNLPPGRPLPSASGDLTNGGMTMRGASDSPVSGNPFTERTTQTETPTINITGTCPTTDTVYFRGANGQNYSMIVPPGQTASLQLPAGEYEFRLIPGDAGVHGQYGDATFRQFRAYDLCITTGPDYGERGHIGD